MHVVGVEGRGEDSRQRIFRKYAYVKKKSNQREEALGVMSDGGKGKGDLNRGNFCLRSIPQTTWTEVGTRRGVQESNHKPSPEV